MQKAGFLISRLKSDQINVLFLPFGSGVDYTRDMGLYVRIGQNQLIFFRMLVLVILSLAG